jgi:hypothetical protein
MTDAKTDYLEDAILNHVLRNTAYTSPTTIYVALFTTLPADDGTGGVEVSGGSYARQAVTFAAPSSGAVANSGAVTFPTATASWGTVLGMGLFDAVSGGNLLYFGALVTSKTVDSGDQISFANAALSVQET